MTCLTTYNVAGPCACGKPMEPAHLTPGQAPCCKACCPEHKDADHSWHPAPPSDSAEQASLFESTRGDYDGD